MHISSTHFCPAQSTLPALQREEGEELVGLEDEAELPLEELLARYGNYHLHAHQGPEESEGKAAQGWGLRTEGWCVPWLDRRLLG